MPWPGKIFPELFNNVQDAGDGFPGLQGAIRNWTKDYLHSGGIETGILMEDNDITGLRGIYGETGYFITGVIGIIPDAHVYGIIRPYESTADPFDSGTQDGELYWNENDEALYRWEEDIEAWIQIGS
ncbi:MAG: hypothetical protein ACTSQK_02920 [Candidatus Heimdallarchaeota archaeon]